MAETQQVVSSGVKELIEKLENDGVKQGKLKADAIIEEAERKADKILTDAREESAKLRGDAKKEADSIKAAGEEELKMALRDSVLVLRKNIENTFTKQVGSLITEALDDKEMLGKVILEIVGSAKEKTKIASAKEVNVLIPEKAVSLDDLRQDGAALKDSALTKFAMGIKKDLLKEGVTFKPSDKVSSGIKVYIKDTKVEVDLSDRAVSEILLEHLQPRFRAILEGVVS